VIPSTVSYRINLGRKLALGRIWPGSSMDDFEVTSPELAETERRVYEHYAFANFVATARPLRRPAGYRYRSFRPLPGLADGGLALAWQCHAPASLSRRGRIHGILLPLPRRARLGDAYDRRLGNAGASRTGIDDVMTV
jgi:hypothetical protein